jgi:glycosyltransferase involved in cell wall biosynthesis
MERAVFLQARHLHARGVETVLVTRPATRGEGFPGEVVTVPYGAGLGRPGGVLDRTLRYPGFSRRVGEAVAGLVRAGRVDVVDAQGLTALGYGRLRAQDPSLRAPLVMNPQGMEEHHARGFKRAALWRLRALSREAAALADRVVATDEVLRDEVPRLLGVSAEKVVVLPNGVDPEEIAGLTPPDPEAFVAARIPGLSGAHPVYLSVGRLEAYKGSADALRALAMLHAQGGLPAEWAWVAVGAGPAADRLLASVPDALRGHVVLPGRVDEALLHALYARADAFVHATHYEGSSLVTLEAMVHGLPVVATRAGGIPDKVVDGQTGWLVEPGDTAGLAARLAEVARDPAAARAAGARGRERARTRFSSAVLIERTIAAYEALLAERTQ